MTGEGTHHKVSDEEHPLEAIPPQTTLPRLPERHPIVVVVAVARHPRLVRPERLAPPARLGDRDRAVAFALPALHAPSEDVRGELGREVVDGERRALGVAAAHERGVVLGGHGAVRAGAGAVGERGGVEAAAVVVHACEHVAGGVGGGLDGRRVRVD